MKVVFVSNYFNHHQQAFSNAMVELIGDKYVFIATSEMRLERIKLGYSNDQLPSYVKKAHFSKKNWNECIKIINDADVVIVGSAPEELLKSRIKQNKLLFRYQERIFKPNLSLIQYLKCSVAGILRNQRNKNIYLLCAGGFTASDYRKIGLFKNRAYKWGYFPKTEKYQLSALMTKKQNKNILWCGRFLDWKHPDDAVRIAKRLYDDGYNFKLNIIGTGEMESDICKLIEENHLGGYITLLGSMPPEKVREHMEKAGIYLFTSDRQEGWGAVLNESMNSGCAVVASHAIGSVPYLLKNGENGYIYKSGNVDELYEKVKYLLDNPAEQKRVGEAAYLTITEEWNAEIAAERFIYLAEHILDGEKSPDLYESGPCSKAENIKDDWFEDQ